VSGPTENFQIRIPVRVYELDTQGHLNSAVFMQYAEHARWEHLSAVGTSVEALLGSGIGPVFLESTIRWSAEVLAGDALTVNVVYEFSEEKSKTFLIHQSLRREDGATAAQLTSRCGLLDLKTRRMVADPRARLDAISPGFSAKAQSHVG
jgi:acyl-CoA thioester hydrolase